MSRLLCVLGGGVVMSRYHIIIIDLTRARFFCFVSSITSILVSTHSHVPCVIPSYS